MRKYYVEVPELWVRKFYVSAEDEKDLEDKICSILLCGEEHKDVEDLGSMYDSMLDENIHIEEVIDGTV